REAFEKSAQVMRVRIHREHIEIGRNLQLVGDREITLASRDIERAIVLQLEEHREFRSRLAAEIESDGRLYRLRLADGFQVNVQYQVVARVEAPRHPRRLTPWRAAGLPE